MTPILPVAVTFFAFKYFGNLTYHISLLRQLILYPAEALYTVVMIAPAPPQSITLNHRLNAPPAAPQLSG